MDTQRVRTPVYVHNHQSFQYEPHVVTLTPEGDYQLQQSDFYIPVKQQYCRRNLISFDGRAVEDVAPTVPYYPGNSIQFSMEPSRKKYVSQAERLRQQTDHPPNKDNRNPPVSRGNIKRRHEDCKTMPQ